MSQPMRLGLVYAALFIGTGASSPYIPVWFAHRGLSGAEIGLILSAPMLARAVTAPAIAMWADSFRLRRTPLILMALAAALAYGLLAAPFGLAWWFGVWFVASTLISTMAPLTDVVVFRRAGQDGFNYGFPRGIGSVAYIIANVAVGALLARYSPELVLVWITGAAILAAGAARGLLPPDTVREGGGSSRLSERLAGLGDLVRDRHFMLAVVSVGLAVVSAPFFGAILWAIIATLVFFPMRNRLLRAMPRRRRGTSAW